MSASQVFESLRVEFTPQKATFDFSMPSNAAPLTSAELEIVQSLASGDSISVLDLGADNLTINGYRYGPLIDSNSATTGVGAIAAATANAEILDAAVQWCSYRSKERAYGTVRRVSVPPGRWVFNQPLLMRQSTNLVGATPLPLDGCAELWWIGDPDEVRCIYTDKNAINSGLLMQGLRIIDKRTTKNRGVGVAAVSVYNNCRLEHLQVFGFPDVSIAVAGATVSAGTGLPWEGAAGPTASDCVVIDDVWVGSEQAGSKGIYLRGLDNVCLVRNVKSDHRSGFVNGGTAVGTRADIGAATGGAVIYIEASPVDNCALVIDGVKHECSDATPTVYLNGNTVGNVSIKNVQQRVRGTNPAGGAAIGGHVVYANVPSGAVNGLLENINGDAHNSWGGSVDCCTYRAYGSANQKVFERIHRATIGTLGRCIRSDIPLAGNPASTGVYGNPGDTAIDTSTTTGSASLRWQKMGGAASQGYWRPVNMRRSQSQATFGGGVTFDINTAGNTIFVATAQDSACNIANVANPADAELITFDITQNGTGGFAITFTGSEYKFAIAPFSNAGNTAGKRTVISFIRAGGAWIQQNANTWF